VHVNDLFTTLYRMENAGPVSSRYDIVQRPLTDARARVLETMQRLSTAVSANQIAVLMDLHENTARKHLDGLAYRGLLDRVPNPATGRGRPGFQYRARASFVEPDARVRDYVGLASALASHIARTSDNPRRDAIAAGSLWGAELAADPRYDALSGHETVLTLLGELGFAPEFDPAERAIALKRCPLLDAVRSAPEVVCAVHLGFARGALAARGSEASAVGLTPFAEVGSCTLHLA